MDKFKELSFEEISFINGGMDSTSMQPFKDASETWGWKVLHAMNDVADFVSGLGEGFLDGFSQASKSWH